MDLLQVYLITIGGIFGVLLFLNGRPWIVRALKFLYFLGLRRLVYRYVLRRHRLIGPWSLAGVLLQLVYTAGTITCFSLADSHVENETSVLSRVGLQAGTASVINLIPLFASTHLDFIADLLGITVVTAQQIHLSMGLTAILLTAFHVIVAIVTRPHFAWSLAQNQFAVIGASSLGCIVLLSLPPFRERFYGIFLRIHQAFSALAIVAIWRHLPPNQQLALYSLYILAGLFAVSTLVQVGLVCYRNGLLRAGHAQAQARYDNGAIKLSVQCRKPLKIKAGQHINLWIRSIGFGAFLQIYPFVVMAWPFLQSHPFVVTSWSEKPQGHMDLFIEPRRGLTRRLLSQVKGGHEKYSHILFSGPHGRSVEVDGYNKILMIASDFGIAAHLPYLKQIIQGYNTRKLHTGRVHLVWQVRDIEIAIAAEPLLNGALEEDRLDNGWILSISIYCESNHIPSTSFGKRANIYPGKAPLQDIFGAEIAGEQPTKKPVRHVDWNTQRVVDGSELESAKEVKEDLKMLITVSAAGVIRDDLRNMVRDHLSKDVRFYELDYQPS